MGCKPCLPVPAYNEFNQVFDRLDGFEPIIPAKTIRFTPAELNSQIWPVQPGDYRVLNPVQSIAIALLQGGSISGLSSSDLSRVVIAGSIITENLGIEHLIKNVIANPYIRHLVLCGNDIQGHFPGDALLNLLDNGVDPQNRIIGARGARPVLKNLTPVEVDHFRSQVKAQSLIGGTKPSDLGNLVSYLNQLKLPPFESGLRVDVVEVKKAEPAKRLRLDPAGYFVIMVMKGREQPIWVEHYTNDDVLRNVIEGKDAATLCATLIEMNLISQLDHAAYLGRELAKAELSQSLEFLYIQDKAQGESICGVSSPAPPQLLRGSI
jgi:tetrahydromethanopterin S-methyltransferase subunit A